MAEIHGSVLAKALGFAKHACKSECLSKADVQSCTQCPRLLRSQIRYGKSGQVMFRRTSGAAVGRARIRYKMLVIICLPASNRSIQALGTAVHSERGCSLRHWPASCLDLGSLHLNWRCARPAFKQFSSSRQKRDQFRNADSVFLPALICHIPRCLA